MSTFFQNLQIWSRLQLSCLSELSAFPGRAVDPLLLGGAVRLFFNAHATDVQG
jgi:hypothetical protein